MAMCAFPETLSHYYPTGLIEWRLAVEDHRPVPMFVGSFIAWVGICLFQGWWSCALVRSYSRPSKSKKFLWFFFLGMILFFVLFFCWRRCWWVWVWVWVCGCFMWLFFLFFLDFRCFWFRFGQVVGWSFLSLLSNKVAVTHGKYNVLALFGVKAEDQYSFVLVWFTWGFFFRWEIFC